MTKLRLMTRAQHCAPSAVLTCDTRTHVCQSSCGTTCMAQGCGQLVFTRFDSMLVCYNLSGFSCELGLEGFKLNSNATVGGQNTVDCQT